jgi:hypothetical protein
MYHTRTTYYFVTNNLPSHDEQLVHPRDEFHRTVLMCDYSEFLLHEGEFQPSIRTLAYFRD